MCLLKAWHVIMEPTAVDRYGEYSGNYTSNLTEIYLLFYTLFGVPYLIYTPTIMCVICSVDLLLRVVMGLFRWTWLQRDPERPRTKGIILGL